MRFVKYILHYRRNLRLARQLSDNLKCLSKSAEGRDFQLKMAKAAALDLTRYLEESDLR